MAYSPHPLQPFPKVIDNLAEDGDISKIISRQRAPARLNELIDASPNTLFVPSPASSSPDLFLGLPASLVAFQCKHSSTPLSWGELEAELNKSAPFATTKRPLCFVIVAFTIGRDLEEHLKAYEVGIARALSQSLTDRLTD